MAVNEREIPKYVYEDLLFERRLQRNLSSELERVNNLLAEQIKLLEGRKQLMADVREAVQRRWTDEEQSTLIDPAKNTEEEARDE